MRNLRASIGLLLMASVFATGAAHGQAADAVVPIAPAANVDENLFLLRALETTYDRWPRDITDRQWLQDWLVQARGRTTRLRALIRAESLDSDVGSLYDDCLMLLDAYETYLANLGAIDRGATTQAQRDRTKVNETAFRMSFQTAEEASRQGYSSSKSIGLGFLAGVIGGAYENYQRSQQLDESKREAAEAEARQVSASWATIKANAEVLAAKLTRNHGWRTGEAGFDGFTSEKMGDLLARRPRDPFLRVANARIRVKDETPDDILNDARACLAAASLVPGNTLYDPYRAEFVAAAADLAVLACGKELPDFAYSSGPARSATEALRLCRTLLAYEPADTSGTGQMLLARALACAGRYPEAIEAANQATPYHQDPYFAYRYARLMSLNGQTDKAREWFAHALRRGFSEIATSRKDPDLKPLRADHGDAFEDLTRVKFSWKIHWGVVGPDEIVLENNSLFPLTNVSLDVTVTSTGYADWKETLTCDSIPAGGRHTWSFDGKGITSRGSDAKGQGSLSSDQNE